MSSFHKLYDILSIAKPQIVFYFIQVALDITKEEYEQSLLPITKHPKFPDVIKKVDYYLKIKSDDV